MAYEVKRMLERVFKKSEPGFALTFISVYVLGVSAVQSLTAQSRFPSLAPFAATLLLSILLLVWLIKRNRTVYFGLCKPKISAKTCLYYLPLVLMISCNVWGGFHVHTPQTEALLYVGNMLCVGFLEEILFRGLLFRAMAKTNVRSAMIVSSVTFGIGHIVNLINGSGTALLSNLLQVCYAIAIGFLFTYLFYKTESLWACIITHSALNALSVFAPESPPLHFEILSAVALCIIPLGYLAYLVRVFKK